MNYNESSVFLFQCLTIKLNNYILTSCTGIARNRFHLQQVEVHLWRQVSCIKLLPSPPALQHPHGPAWVVPHLQRQDGSAATGLRLPDGVLRGVLGAAGARGQHDRWEREHSFALQCVSFQLRCSGAAARYRLATLTWWQNQPHCYRWMSAAHFCVHVFSICVQCLLAFCLMIFSCH